MTKSLKYLFFILLLGVVVFLAYQFRFYFQPPQPNIISSKEVILERLEQVNKLITLEAYYSEVKDYSDYYYYDISLLRKKALVRVKAKVSIGYDFKDINMVADESTKTVTIKGFPDPEILSIDHDIDYYDITEGTFNSFTTSDYNKLNADAKDFIRTTAEENETIFKEASEKKDELIDMFSWMLQAAGWELKVSSNNQDVKNLENSY